jgi:hypothetical protein
VDVQETTSAQGALAEKPKLGFRTALTGIVCGFLGALVANLQNGAAGKIADSLLDLTNKRTFVVEYAPPVASPIKTITVADTESKKEAAIVSYDRTHAVVRGAPGIYEVTLTRADDLQQAQGVVEVTKEKRKVTLPTEAWLEPELFTTLSLPPSDALSETRFNVVPADFEVKKQSANELSRRIVDTALSQVGTNAGTQRGAAAISQYWAYDAPAAKSGVLKEPPWGGVMLGWVVAKSGATPPPHAASFTYWRDWGAEIDPVDVQPGMLAIFQLVGDELPQALSRLLVGVVLRKKKDCIEVVVGNIAHRVAITCVHRELIGVRLPTLTGRDSE